MEVTDRLDEDRINTFINATVNVIKTMAFTDVKASPPYLKIEKTAKGDLSGIIGFTGDSTGSLSVSFPERSILLIVSNMFGEEMDTLDDEIRDASGEITNMISGQARQELEEMGLSLDAAIPTVISGRDHTIKHITSYPIVAITFTIGEGEFMSGDGDEFTIEICIES